MSKMVMINEDRLFSEVLSQLGDHSRIVEEAVENGYRIGAKKVVIEISDDLKQLSIWNDGPELIDFSPLLIVAETGYDEHVIRSNKPAGMGIMMMIAASKTVTFTSGDQTMSVEGKLFFSDKEHRESRIDSVSKTEEWNPGFKICMEFEVEQKWLENKYKKHLHHFNGLEYHYDLEITLKAPFVTLDEPLKKASIPFLFSKRGKGALAGAEIGIHVSTNHRYQYNCGAIFWHGKKIDVPRISPFIVKVDGEFGALQPRLPDRTGIVNTEDEINSVKLEIESQLADLIQNYCGNMKSDVSVFVSNFKGSYDVDGCGTWQGAYSGATKMFFVGNEDDGEVYLNGEAEEDDSYQLLDAPDGICWGKLKSGGTAAPKWVRDIAIDNRVPKIEINQSDKALEASKAAGNWSMYLCESITVDGVAIDCIYINEEMLYFTSDYDGESYKTRLCERYDEVSSSQIDDEVEEDIRSIVDAYNGSANLYEAIGYAESLLRQHAGNYKVKMIVVNVDERVITITPSEGEPLVLPLK